MHADIRRLYAAVGLLVIAMLLFDFCVCIGGSHGHTEGGLCAEQIGQLLLIGPDDGRIHDATVAEDQLQRV